MIFKFEKRNKLKNAYVLQQFQQAHKSAGGRILDVDAKGASVHAEESIGPG
jgi:hypothetical protein